MADLKIWLNKCYKELEEDTKEFNKLYRRMCDDIYDSSLYHYKVVYDFKEFTRKVIYDSTLDSNHFRVRVFGQSRWYSYGDHKEEVVYKPDHPGPENAIAI